MVFGTARNFHKKFKFKVEFGGTGGRKALFQKSSEISVEVAKVEYWEGGTLIPDKSPGRVTVADVTLERGVTVNIDLWNWMKEVANIAANSGEIDPSYKRVVDHTSLNRDNSTLRKWRLHGAWPTVFVAGEWDNEADENVIEKVTLTYDYPELINSESST